MTGSETVTGARRALGGQLGAMREAAGYTQHQLAKLVGYARSTIASVEAGQGAARQLWEACDQVLSGSGALVSAYDEIERMRRQRQEAAASAAQTEREARAREWYAQHGTRWAHANTIAGEPVAATDVIHDLEARVLDAHRGRSGRHDASLTLVGGFAGSGKSEFARFLSEVTGWAILDKDTLTRPLVEQLLLALAGDANDRDTALYLERARPHEYRCLLDSGLENLRVGVTTVLTAPFLRELSDEAWLLRVKNRCAAYRATLNVVWVRCDPESMYD
jgi:DNA-binding XRE family transcriptional regulator/predicted kinase